MNDTIKGFSIELDLDSIKVDSGLRDLKSSMRLMNSEMKSNMSAFSYGEKSLKKYGVQLDGLNKKLELQKTVTESARKHYEKMVDEHGEGSRQAENAAAAFNRESAQLNNLERHIGKVTDEMRAFKREQEIQNTTLYKTGERLTGFGDGLQDISSKARDLGGKLTKWITVPALAVATAAGGIVSAFGWERLVGVDSAQAQLRGLGYEAEDVERISDQLAVALEGGMLTMGEATSAAATAMAAGVKEGTELTRYIQILDGTVAGSTGTFEEMEQIFGRIVDQGSMTRNEFDMIAQRMPGFSKAVQENMDISSDEMYEMLRNGEITTDKFLDIMEDFSGDMATEYAKSWQGMVANTKAYIGILGENLLGGVFEKSKESIAEFIEILSSDEVQEWAEETGDKLGEVFADMVDKVKSVIKWYTNLNENNQKIILGLGSFVVALGPILVGLGTLGGIVGKVSSGIGTLFKVLAPLTVPLTKIGGAAAKGGKSIGILRTAFTALTGPVGIAIAIITALATAFTVAYKKSETFSGFIGELGTKIKEAFFGVVEWVQPGIDAVVNFFGEIKEKITGFTEEEGPQLMEAFGTIGSFISTVAGAIGTAVSWAFEHVIKPVIEFVMPFIEEVIRTTWSGIKSIITGALDVIMGAIKLFSGIFTGDFSKMWEGVKQIFSGSIQVVWGMVKTSFVGNILISIINFASNFKSNMSNMWQSIKNKFTEKISEIWTGIKESFVGRIIASIIGFAARFKQNISSMWSSLRNTFTNRINSIRSSIENSFVGKMITSVTKLKTNFIKLAGEMWTGVKNKFNDIVGGAKALPGRIGDGIRNAKDKAVSGMKSVGNSIIKWAGTPFNKVVDGVNWITGKLGIDSKIDTWDYPQYAKGTKGHPGGAFVAGEKGREIVQMPDGRSFITPGTDTFYPDMPKGTQVVPNNITEKILKSDIPHYAKGTGIWDSIKKGASKVKDVVSDVWDYATNPGKLVNLVMDKISVIKDKAQIPTKLVTGGFNYLKKKPIEYIKKMFSDSDAGSGGKPAFNWPVTSNYGYRIHPITGVPKLHGGTDFGAPMGAPIPSQTGGTVSFAGWNSGGFGNLVKVKQGMWEMFYAHMSKVLVRAGQSVKKGDILGNVGSTGASTGPHLHYEKRKNGVRTNPMKGFKTGGVIKSKMMAMLGEEGEEVVIPTAKNRRTDAMKLLALAANKIGANNGSYSRPSNVGASNGNDALLEATLKQNEILLQILNKDNNVTINKKDMTDVVNEKNALDALGSYF